ncbi:MAG: CHC2 zinc finger domain-containing protein, partial [Vulcanimicrobiaceae bacterium]
MRFDQTTIRELHARTDIGTFIGEYVQLRKRGRDLVGLCPFHAEKTPSFHVHPEDGFFKCFGCGVAGDVIEFAKRIESLPFADAVRFLAKRSGVTLEEETPQAAHARSEREAIFEANAIAAAFFERMFAASEGAKARDYCRDRGLQPAILERFGIGFAPD